MKKKLLTDIHITSISLVKTGANRRTVILKSDGSRVRIAPIAKYDGTEGILYGIVYAPDETDSQGDFTTAAEIRKASYRFMKNLNLLNIDHEHDGQKVSAYVCESWILKGKDPMFPKERPGAWAVGIVLQDDGLKAKAINGEIGGLSMAGFAVRKSFDEESFKKDLLTYTDALQSDIVKALDDAEVTDKAAAVASAIDAFKAAVTGKIESQDVVPADDADKDGVVKSELANSVKAITETMQGLTARLIGVEEYLKKSRQATGVSKGVSDDEIGASIAAKVNRK